MPECFLFGKLGFEVSRVRFS